MDVERERRWIARVPETLPVGVAIERDLQAAVPLMRQLAATVARLPAAPSSRLRPVERALRGFARQLRAAATAVEAGLPVDRMALDEAALAYGAASTRYSESFERRLARGRS